MNLVLHCGARKVDRAVLARVVPPERTNTYCPLGHEDFVAQVEQRLAARGIPVASSAYALSLNGQQFFGLMEVTPGMARTPDDYGMVVGLRNSYNKTLPAGLVVGTQVFVCDNLAFVGDVVVVRKHTSRLDDDLTGLIDGAVTGMVDSFRQNHERVTRYKNQFLTGDQADHLLLELYRRQAIGRRQFPVAVKEWDQPQFSEFVPRTLWSLSNAVTFAMREQLADVPERTQELYKLCDGFVSAVN